MRDVRRWTRSTLGGPALLVLAVALVVGIPTLVLGEIAADDTRARVRAAQLSALRSSAERVEAAITETLAGIRYYLGYASRPNLGRISALAERAERGDIATIQAELVSLLRVFPPESVTLILYDPAGELKAAAGRPFGGASVGGARTAAGSAGIRPDALPIPADRFQRRQMGSAARDHLARSNAAVALDPLDPEGVTEGRSVSIGISVTGSDLRTPAGFLFVLADLNFLGGALLKAGAGASEVYVLDRGGRLLRRLSKTVTDTDVGRDLSSTPAVAELLRGRGVDGEAADPLGGGQQLVTSSTIQPLSGAAGAPDLDVGWHILAEQPVALVYADVEAAITQFRYVRIALLALLLGGAFALGVTFQQIRAQRRLLEVASRHKSEFLANMSHELRTPLNAVIGFSDVLLGQIAGTVNAKQAEYLEDIRASGRHLLSLINDILDLSKVEAGRMELQLGEFSLPHVLGDGVTMIRERAGEHQITISLDVDPALGTLVADERKVKQVVANLLSNAVKFTPDGGCIAVHAARANREVRVTVEDTGVGIAAADQARIFEEFEQTKHGREAAEGTGLGLTLSKKIVELHGGRIWVDSEVGKGSTFTFALPLVPVGKEG